MVSVMVLEIYNKNIDELNTFEKLIRVGKLAREEDELESAKSILKAVAQEAMSNSFGNMNEVSNFLVAILRRIAQIDKILSDFSDEVLHHSEFQKLESSWRGLHKFIIDAEVSDTLQVKVMQARKKELLKDIEDALDFDQSSLFKKIYEEEYGTFGGTPFSLFIADYYFDKSAKDISLIDGLSHVAAAAHTPVISGVSPQLFGMESFLELPNPQDLKNLFKTSNFLKWNYIRSGEDAKYISLAMPRVLQRQAYNKEGLETQEFQYTETIDSNNHNHYLWGNAAYAVGTRITAAFNQHSWCAAIRGVEGGGLIENLPVHLFTNLNGEQIIKCPTETPITDRREKELSDLGFIALCYKKNSNSCVIFDTPTIAEVKDYEDPMTRANAFVAVQLQYLLAASRFAHYLKVIMRDKIGSFATLNQVSSFLNGWLLKYALGDDNAPAYFKAKFPLREGRVDVYEVPGRPGSYKAICFLRPHFQLNELSVSIRMVAELPAPAAA